MTAQPPADSPAASSALSTASTTADPAAAHEASPALAVPGKNASAVAALTDMPGGLPAVWQAPSAPLLPATDVHREARRGLWWLGLGFCGLLLWAAFAPLDSGVPAPGVVAVESTRKKIDHAGGGVIDAILVREGDRVQAGQELLRLNPVQAQAAFNATQSQWATATAAVARLTAEREGAAQITFPPELLALKNQPDVAKALRVQQELFRARRATLQGQMRVLQESTQGMGQQVQSLDALKTGRQKQLGLLNEQLSAYEKLKADGYVSRNYLADVERQVAEVQSRQSEDLAKIADVQMRLAEFRAQLVARQAEYQREVETQFTDAQREAATLSERLAALQDTVQRLSVRAPVAGTVVDLAFHTEGATIKPGDRILDLVPQGDALVVEAQLAPQYIDRIHRGLSADVHFDAYSSQLEQPVLHGRVDTVSADALSNPRTGESYYTLRVTVPPEQTQHLRGLQLQPGMQATVMVRTGESTLLVYLLRPFMRRMTTAMRE